MRKIVLFILTIVVVSLVGSSCDNQKTAMELMKEERKAIDRFIDGNGLIILDEYPEDGVFKEKEYFHDANGLYIHVVDSGNGNKAQLYQTVTGRYKGLVYFKTDTTKITTEMAKSDLGNQPDEFIYGVSASYGSGMPYMSSSAWAIALGYVSENAEVSLIVPSSVGTAYDQSNFVPVFFESIKFRFY